MAKSNVKGNNAAGQTESSVAIRALLRLAKAIIEFARGHIKESLASLKLMV